MTRGFGKNSTLLFCKTADTIGVTHGVDLVEENLVHEQPMYDEDGLIGGRQLGEENAACLAKNPSGSFAYRPRYAEMELLSELALGEADTDTWIPDTAGDLPTFKLQNNRAGIYAEDWTVCRIAELLLRSEQNLPLIATPTVLGTTAAEQETPLVPTYASIEGVPPIYHSDLAITGDLGALTPFVWQLHIDNMLDAEGYANSVTRQDMESDGIACTMEMEISLDDTILSSWATKYAAKTGCEIVSTFTAAGGDKFIATFNGIITTPPPSVSGPGKQRATIVLEGRAVKSGGVITTNMIKFDYDAA